MIFHQFDTLLVIKMCYFAFFVFLGESYNVLPNPGLGNCNSVSCDLHGFYMFYLMVALFAKPRNKIFLYPSAIPVPHCRFPCPDPENVDFTSVYDRFWGVVFCSFAMSETSRFCFAIFLHCTSFRWHGFLSLEMTHQITSDSHVLPHGSSFPPRPRGVQLQFNSVQFSSVFH